MAYGAGVGSRTLIIGGVQVAHEIWDCVGGQNSAKDLSFGPKVMIRIT
jgi:hypothetical protein